MISSCKDIWRLEPRESDLGEERTKVLGHRGAGYNSLLFRENTSEGIEYALDRLGGVEVDIAISKDGGLWLSHDDNVWLLDKPFIDATDEEIADVRDENGQVYYDKLEDILVRMVIKYPSKHISLDVKNPKELFKSETFSSVAKKLADFTDSYNFEGKISVQSDSLSFLKMVREESSGIETYYLTWGDFDQGIKRTYENYLTGISFDHDRKDDLTKSMVDLAHSLNLKVLVYSIEDSFIDEVYGLQVDFIETDNMAFFELLYN
ncbi:glycerophosphodiester phosphodiesterase [Arcticibacterium luteifluviistationis]|uniref:glycerophosphodiester phosphodiesterase n=1 Tax=Arcticibacterium luteifluviistationis TaxID=1784714 RepID=UPI0013A6C8DA|nr:glycerophosphodiester phosphodiesterase [Arcticibacterium luteifluviistationis]